MSIEGFSPKLKYSILLTAVPKDDSLPLVSNQLEVTLPLNINQITLPDPSLRDLENDFYDEYIEIIDLDSKSKLRSNNYKKK